MLITANRMVLATNCAMLLDPPRYIFEERLAVNEKILSEDETSIVAGCQGD
jgi:hypothetical protein